MTTSSDERNPVELLAEEFLDRKRRGEQPTLQEYLERHPAMADEIRDLFPAILMIEDLGGSSGATTGSLAAENGAATGMRLQRLGDYRILRQIGRGGMGVVYEAEQESLGRRVALKVLSTGSLLDPKQVRRFEREAKAAAKLHHTNIVPVFGVGQHEGHHYFVMQLIVGLGLDVVLDDLRRLRTSKSSASLAAAAAPSSRIAGLTGADVARSLFTGQFDEVAPAADGSITEPFDDATRPLANGTPSDSSSSPTILPMSSELSVSSDPDRQFYRSIARIGVQVAEALEYANRQGILHRDVKPSNLLLDNHGNVWVADFGLAKSSDADDLTHTGDILGTIRYMAPERFSGHCDARSDVYSLGLTLYELAGLRPAYEASDRHRLMERVLHEQPERLRKVAPGVPRDLETIIAKATAREPAGRYATASALAEDLRRFVEDRPIRARRVSPTERLARWCRRNPWLATSVGLAAASMVLALVLGLVHVNRQDAANKRISQLAADLQGERGRLKIALSESNSRLARSDLERGLAAFEKGRIGVGMLWTVESLRVASEAGDEDGRRVALANLAAWRRQLRELKGVFTHGGGVTAAAFSPDGKTILTGGRNKMARFWDARTGEPIGQPLMGKSEFSAVAFHPDGKTILTGDWDQKATLWDAASGRTIGDPIVDNTSVNAVAFSPDGKKFLTASGVVVRQWDIVSGRPVGPPLAHPGLTQSAAYSPDGKLIVTGCMSKAAQIWDATIGGRIGQPMFHPDAVAAVTFSPDSSTIVTACWDGTARRWDTATGTPIGQPLVHSGRLSSLAVSPDGKTILTGCIDGSAQLWDASSGQPIGSPLEHQASVSAVAFSPDGKTILTGSEDGTARLWDGEVAQCVSQVLEYEGPTAVVAFGADGKNLVTVGYDGKAWIRDIASGHRLSQPVTQASPFNRAALSRDGRRLVLASWDKTARIWDAGSGRPIGQPMPHSAFVTSLAFSPDGKTVLTGCSNGKAQRWDAATGAPIGDPLVHSGLVSGASFSPDGKTILTASADSSARRWDAGTGAAIGPPMVHSGALVAAYFSPDGKKIVTGSSDKTVRVWDSATGHPLGQPIIHSRDVMSVVPSPDGKSILTATSDRTVRLWDFATSQQIGPPMPHAGIVKEMAFSPDEQSMFTCEYLMRPGVWSERDVRQWHAPAAIPDDVARLSAWVEAITGLELQSGVWVRVLDKDAWRECIIRLESLGGPPPPHPAPRLDPILFGPDPAARGNSLRAQGAWERAEAAFIEASRAHPFSGSIRDSLVQLLVDHGHLDRAVVTLREAVRLMPDDPESVSNLGLLLLASGDRAGWIQANANALARFGETRDSLTANSVAYDCSLGPDGAADPELPVRLAEAAQSGDTNFVKAPFLNTLGAALYRAKRFDEAIRRLEEASRARNGASSPHDAAFLALAHHRLGHRDEAHRWLDRLRNHQPSADAAAYRTDLEIRLLRSEAEAVILYDPVFPADPFAR
jgi:eukaryotic-like serine/threonine-protein kinase